MVASFPFKEFGGAATPHSACIALEAVLPIWMEAAQIPLAYAAMNLSQLVSGTASLNDAVCKKF